MRYAVTLSSRTVSRMPVFTALLGLLLTLFCSTLARADDGIFPPAPAAKTSIDFDGKGFLIHGKRAFIASGSMHYSRIPRALWRDRLLRIKRAGFNTVETYAFWNFHEPQEGKWDFTGDKDVNAYLKLIKALGMYAIVRVGPYVCAEWEGGGYPVWLRFKPGVRVREDNPAFEAAVDAWYDKIMPIVAANQIHRGGAVIMVQLENEHPQGWGKEMPNAYFTLSARQSLGAWPGSALLSSAACITATTRRAISPGTAKTATNPWYDDRVLARLVRLLRPARRRSTARSLCGARGKSSPTAATATTYYMLHGGTNFGTWNDDEDASNYDYGAAIGQTGDLRPIYYQFKRANLFAHSFADVLANSENATDQYKDLAAGSSLRVTARKSEAGTLIFLDNNTDKIIAQGGLSLQPGEIVPLVRDYKLLPNVTLTESNVRILGTLRQSDTTTLVVYSHPHTASRPGNTGDESVPDEHPELKFTLADGEQATLVQGAGAFSHPDEKTRKSSAAPENHQRQHSGLRLYYRRQDRARSCHDGRSGRPIVVYRGERQALSAAGLEYAGEAEERGGKLRMNGEKFISTTILHSLDSGAPLVYGAETKPISLLPSAAFPPLEAWKSPVLSQWQAHPADEEAGIAYLTGNWKYSPQPLQMGVDGDTSAYAWYRTTLRSSTNGRADLRFTVTGDWLAAWVNGQRVPQTGEAAKPRQSYTPGERVINVPLKTGDNTLAVLTAHYGRGKLFNHLGPISDVDQKGLSGPVFLVKRPATHQAVTGWKWKTAQKSASGTPALPAPDFGSDTSDWTALAHPEEDIFNKQRGYAWFATTLNGTAASGSGGAHWKLRFANVDDNATVYLNGKKVGEHKGWGQPFAVQLDSAWDEKGANHLVVLVENTDNTGGIMGPVELQSSNPGDEVELRGWKMRGGIGGEAKYTAQDTNSANWRTLDRAISANAPAAAPTLSPTFYRAEFTAAPPAPAGPHAVLRVTLDGLSRGFIWLNGHNLGRYPEKVPINSLYLPECWLNKGGNSLVIFDEEGNAPTKVHIVPEAASSRVLTEYVTIP